MKLSLLAFTRQGFQLGQKIAASLACESAEYDVCAFATSRIAEELGAPSCSDLGTWTKEQFEHSDALVFIGATGIAVRAIAPFAADKLHDPAVVSIDEMGHFAVPLLSGHVGGANELARKIADATGGQAVISTATDVNGVFAVDEWARSQDMAIVERKLAKEVSSWLLEAKGVAFESDFGIEGCLPENVGANTDELGIYVTLNTSSSPFEHTLHLVPRIATLGVGCRKGADPDLMSRFVNEVLAAHDISPDSVKAVASIDLKSEEEAVLNLAKEFGCSNLFYSAEELCAVPGEFSSSQFVEDTVGVSNVCERAACAAGAHLAVSKQALQGVTVAVALDDYTACFPNCEHKTPKLSIVGLGPGAREDMTLKARSVLEASDVFAGYTVYVELLKEEFPNTPVLTTPMRREVERCKLAFEEAQKGKHVSMVCSGDSGIYGMAGLCYELSEEYPDVELEVIPGVSAANGGAAVLGAPLMHDFAVISLSDLLTPWETIEGRLNRAAEADFVICLYNPSSKKRADYLRRACDILLLHKSPETICGTVRNIGREGEQRQTCTLGELRNANVDMFTTVFIGNASTRVIDGHMVTPRGYLQREENDK